MKKLAKKTKKPAQAAEKKPAAPRKKSGARYAEKKSAAPRRESRGRAAARDPEAQRQRNQTAAVLMFAAAILTACIVLIEGEHIWYGLHSFLLGLFGNCAILWPILLLYVSIVTAVEKPRGRSGLRIGLIVAIILLFSAAVYIFRVTPEDPPASFWEKLVDLYTLGGQRNGSGFAGGLIGIPFVAALGALGAKIVIVLLLFVAFMVLTGTSLIQLFRALAKPVDYVSDSIGAARERKNLEREQMERARESQEIDISLDKDDLPPHPVSAAPSGGKKPKKKSEKLTHLEEVFRSPDPVMPSAPAREEPAPAPEEEKRAPAVPEAEPAPPAPAPSVPAAPAPAAPPKPGAAEAFLRTLAENQPAEPPAPQPLFPQEERAPDGEYHYPPTSMLAYSKKTDEAAANAELEHNGELLVNALKSFGVQTKILAISRGPAVTRYELQPAAGVKISKITSLSDDIAMNLAASGVRIEAPIPGKAAVGIEVPNRSVSVVRMRELVESENFQTAKSKLTVALGRDIAGEVTLADLAKMPHLLIAGSTGSGKSVCINSLIVSLLYKATPDEVRFLMVDPKVVELGVYNGVPHLLVPVVTDPRKAAGALSWAVTEMLHRYKIFAENNVRDLASYNRAAETASFRDADGQPLQKMPQIVIIIDELADLMMAAPNEVEDSICRLAQMARAAGMHLVIATQRPSVDVITGIIKANIPSRIAFAVSSQVDSRTILDMSGAEKLLGRGDMLFSPVGSQKPTRIQGCFVSDEEIESVVTFVKKMQEQGYDASIMEEIEKNAVSEGGKGDAEVSGGEQDPMMEEAIKCVVEAGQASTSLLQRRLRLGYARAGRLIDEMEQMGVVGPHEGSKPRQVLMTYQQYLERSLQVADRGEQTEG